MRMFSILLLGVIMSTIILASSPRQAMAAPCHTLRMGPAEIQVLSLVERDLKTGILLAETAEQQRRIATAYPRGLIHNSLNVLVIRGNGIVALVDTGYAWSFPNLVAALQRVGLSPADVTHVLLTHAHSDHTGGLVQDGKAAFPGARVLFSQKELAYWTSPERQTAAAEGERTLAAEVGAILHAYGDRVSSFATGQDLWAALPGITAVDEAGHTPGHVGIMARGNGQTFLFWADLLHAFDVQALDPALSTAYDMDPAAAARVRTQLLQQARSEGWLVSGAHIPFVQPQQLDATVTP